jgi:hypothetical protein
VAFVARVTNGSGGEVNNANNVVSQTVLIGSPPQP